MDTQEIESTCKMAAVAEQLLLTRGAISSDVKKAVLRLNAQGWKIDIWSVLATAQSLRAKWTPQLSGAEPAKAPGPKAR